jgi:hypothetical protein
MAATAASDAPTVQARLGRRRGEEGRLRRPGPSAPVAASTAVLASRDASASAAASTDSAKPAWARGLALRRAWKLSDVFMVLLRQHRCSHGPHRSG